MKSDKEHIPLSSDELLRLLDEKSNNQTHSAYELDDFEKEALEGFEEHIDSNRAKALLSEIDTAISQKVSEQAIPAKKRGIVWFSAAASIALIVIVSFLVLNKTKDEVNQNIALNEQQQSQPEKLSEEKTINDVSIAESSSGLSVQQDHTAINNEKVNSNKNRKSSPDLILEVQNKANGANSENAVAEGGVLANPVQNKDFDNSSDLANNQVTVAQTDNNVIPVTGNTTTSDNLPSVVYSKQAMEQDMALKTEDAKLKYNEEVAVNTKKKAEANSNAEKSTTKQDHVAVTTVMAPASSVENIGVSAVSLAYYNGGEKAIKEFVLAYLTQNKNTIILKGKFKVIAYVTEKGQLQVLKVDNMSQDCSECVKPLTDALNTMNKWVPMKQGEQTLKSKTEFVLGF